MPVKKIPSYFYHRVDLQYLPFVQGFTKRDTEAQETMEEIARYFLHWHGMYYNL